MKLDINLIPGKNRDGTKDFYKIILLILIFSFVIVIWGYILPKRDKAVLTKSVNKKEQELEELSEIEEEYKAIKIKHDEIKNELDLYDNIKLYKTKMTEIIKDFEELIPTTIFLESINYDDNIMMLTGTAPEYTDISQFMVKIRDSEYVMASILSDVTMLEDEDGNMIGYNFTMSVALLGLEDDEELVEVEEVPAELETGGEE